MRKVIRIISTKSFLQGWPKAKATSHMRTIPVQNLKQSLMFSQNNLVRQIIMTLGKNTTLNNHFYGHDASYDSNGLRSETPMKIQWVYESLELALITATKAIRPSQKWYFWKLFRRGKENMKPKTFIHFSPLISKYVRKNLFNRVVFSVNFCQPFIQKWITAVRVD